MDLADWAGGHCSCLDSVTRGGRALDAARRQKGVRVLRLQRLSPKQLCSGLTSRLACVVMQGSAG